VLIEVPVMLTVVWIVNRSKGWYERGAKANARTSAAPARTRVRLGEPSGR
jgi:ACR3 family arsenite transporter